jgi:hypothetical protein
MSSPFSGMKVSQARNQARKQLSSLLHAGLFLGLLFNHENRGDMYLGQNS